ncbi:MAG TPA: hypothetical protein VGQ72_13340 [Pyrinomonadaceae bacterium]|jgi:hypothetical protein|nr:hypothetical protein [Pyrinomonadaceae bacterium]
MASSGLRWIGTNTAAGAYQALVGLVLIAAGTAILKWLTGLPLHWAIVLGLGAVFVAAMTANIISLIIARHSPARPASAIPECPDKWLHDIAVEQAKAIQNYVDIDCQISSHRLIGGDENLYIDFLFSLDSRCVFKLTLLDEIGGSISFGGTRLTHTPVLADNRVKSLAITDNPRHFELHQRLTKTEAAQLLSEQGSFGFYGLTTQLSPDPAEVEPVRLNLDCSPSINQDFINQNYRKAFIEIEPLPLRTFFRYRKSDAGYDLPTEYLGTVVTMRVRVTPFRLLKLRSFKLITSGPILSPERGEIRETPHIAADGQLVKTGKEYAPNLASLEIDVDRNDTLEGWLQFIVKGVLPNQMLNPASFVVRLHVIDETTEEHRQDVQGLELAY